MCILGIKPKTVKIKCIIHNTLVCYVKAVKGAIARTTSPYLDEMPLANKTEKGTGICTGIVRQSTNVVSKPLFRET